MLYDCPESIACAIERSLVRQRDWELVWVIVLAELRTYNGAKLN